MVQTQSVLAVFLMSRVARFFLHFFSIARKLGRAINFFGTVSVNSKKFSILKSDRISLLSCLKAPHELLRMLPILLRLVSKVEETLFVISRGGGRRTTILGSFFCPQRKNNNKTHITWKNSGGGFHMLNILFQRRA